MIFKQVLALLMISGSVFFLVAVFSIPWNPDFPAPVFASLFLAILSSLPASLLCLRRRKRSFLKIQVALALLGYLFLVISGFVPFHNYEFIIFYAVIGLIFFVAATVLGIVGVSQRIEKSEPITEKPLESLEVNMPTVGEVIAIAHERNLITVDLAAQHDCQPRCQFYVTRPNTLPNGKRLDEVTAILEAVNTLDANRITCRVVEQFAPVRLGDQVTFT